MGVGLISAFVLCLCKTLTYEKEKERERQREKTYVTIQTALAHLIQANLTDDNRSKQYQKQSVFHKMLQKSRFAVKLND